MKFFTGFLFLLFPCFLFAQNNNINFLGRKTYTEELSDVWGYAASGKEYALVGVHGGISIVDVTTPTAPTELFYVTTSASDWHDIATWNGYAYVVNETGGGITIINMHSLPDSVHTYTWTGGSLGLVKAHTIFIDENGIAYVAGGNSSAGRGLLMLDVHTNPTNPVLVGRYDVHYVHDVYVRGDTAWAAEINNGIYSVIDVSNKSAPVVLTTNSTPSSKTHNTWLSADGNTLLTTDEITNSTLASYDVSDLGNITLLDMFQSNPGSGAIVHNVHYVGDFAVASYYRDGVVIVDASHPRNLIEVGNYDTSPFSGGGYNGAWSVYPYLPSGILLVSDIEQGLFVLGPVYEKACYLEGNVTDISNGAPINNVTVTILPASASEVTDLLGDYRTGLADSGTYSVQFLKAGYQTHVENNVVLENGITTTLNVQLIPAIPITLTGSIQNVANGQKIPGSSVRFENQFHTYETVTDSNGDFSIDSFETGIYEAYGGEWGFITKHQSVNIFSATTVVIGLQEGYYDDFMFDFGWTTLELAATGFWQRGEPQGTFLANNLANPDEDVAGDFGNACFVTGNAGGAVGHDDVDSGSVILTSPVFDLSNYNEPFITYSRWFFNGGGTGDSLIVRIFNGVDTAIIETITATTNGWNADTIRVKDFITLSSSMTFTFEASDRGSAGHIVEAAADLFFVLDSNFIPAPEADFVADKTEGCPGEAFVLTASSTNQPVTWFWELPGGIPPSSTDSMPTVVYENPGTYNVTLSATNAGGSGVTTKTAFIQIRETPFVQAFVNDASSASSANGSIILSFSAGTPPYTVEWSTGSNSALIDSLLPGDYYVTVTDSFGCMKSDTVTVGFNTAVAGVSDVNLKVYPNPFSENILFESNENLHITFFNSVGAQVDRIELRGGGKVEWGDHQLPGIYFAEVVRDGAKKKVIKLVKSR